MITNKIIKKKNAHKTNKPLALHLQLIQPKNKKKIGSYHNSNRIISYNNI